MDPIHIADFERNSTEIIRVEITEYKGRKLLNIRTWYKNDEGEYAPTKKGVALDIERFDDLKKAILDAETKIREL